MAFLIEFTEQDINHFKIDSPEKAYTLGFLWGDCHLKKYKIKDGYSNIHYAILEIVKTDLDQIKHLFESWGDWSTKFRKRLNRREQGIISLYDRNFGWFLTINDYLIKSRSEPTKILSSISEIYKPYWWRGFIDADGCFYQHERANQFSIAGSYIQNWDETKNLFYQLNIDKYQIQHRIHKKSKSSAIRISNKIDIIKLGDYIYADNLSIGLNRKLEKFLKIKSNI